MAHRGRYKIQAKKMSAPTSQIQNYIRSLGSPANSKLSARFFKTGKGQYGHGDRFLGLTVPQIRLLVKKYPSLELVEVAKLLKSSYHEERLTALLILVRQFEIGGDEERTRIYRAYIKNIRYINNWDLVDLSAPKIVGAYLSGKNKDILYRLARSENLWERRIAILATFNYIYQGRAKETLKIAKMLLGDTHDLIHKAVGWMLREVGKRCGQDIEENFLKKHARVMPRTMLRYAIERFSPAKRYQYMNQS